jgi:hypothetical protein
MRRHSPGALQQAHDGWTFREALESQKKDNTSLLHLIHPDDLKCVDFFRPVFKVFFQGFLVSASFIDSEDSTARVVYDAPIAKVD